MKTFKFINNTLLISALFAPLTTLAADVSLLNVSYDPTRELYVAYNKAFASYWKNKTGDNVLPEKQKALLRGLMHDACKGV